MPVLKKVLVAVDFSKLSHEALDYAIELARSAKASVTALYVVEPIEFAGVDVLGGAPMASQAIVDEHLKQARVEMERLRTRKLADVPGSKAVVRLGRPADEICALGGKGRSNLIVVGTHGRSGLAHLVMGSVAERVVRHANCPVLVVPGRRKAGGR
jgi:universal stress protein A